MSNKERTDLDLDDACAAFKRAYNATRRAAPEVIAHKGSTLYLVNREHAHDDIITIPECGYFTGRRIG